MGDVAQAAVRAALMVLTIAAGTYVGMLVFQKLQAQDG
jgi:hypothetical protein